MMVETKNYFSDFRLDNCCQITTTVRPFLSYVYFIDGYAYACSSYIGLVVSLLDIGFHDEVINLLNGNKIKRDDFQNLNQSDKFFVDAESCLYSSDENIIQVKLNPLDEEDQQRDYQKIVDVLWETKRLKESTSSNTTQIKINNQNLNSFLASIPKSASIILSIINAQKTYVELSDYPNSFGLIMGMAVD